MKLKNDVFKIGSDVKGCTERPGFLKKNDIYFVDCPGFLENIKVKEYTNQTSVHMI